MSKEKGCVGCANNIGGTYCTMQKDMNAAKYRKCDGRKTLPKIAPKSKQAIPKRKRKITAKGDEYFANDFMKFIKKGGSWSARTGEFIIQTE